MKVLIPTPLHSYTAAKSIVEANGKTVGEVLSEMDRRYPGFRFRIIDEQDGIRPHIRMFVNNRLVPDLGISTQPDDTLHIICALSGG